MLAAKLTTSGWSLASYPVQNSKKGVEERHPKSHLKENDIKKKTNWLTIIHIWYMYITNIIIYNIHVKLPIFRIWCIQQNPAIFETSKNPHHLPPTLASRSNSKDSNQRPPFSQALAPALGIFRKKGGYCWWFRYPAIRLTTWDV